MDLAINSDFCDSPIDQPPSSTFISDTSSAPVSESDLPPPSSPNAKKQTGLFNFFPKIPSEEFHTKWWKRKWENEERDQEEYAKWKQKDEAEKLHKQAHRCSSHSSKCMSFKLVSVQSRWRFSPWHTSGLMLWPLPEMGCKFQSLMNLSQSCWILLINKEWRMLGQTSMVKVTLEQGQHRLGN